MVVEQSSGIFVASSSLYMVLMPDWSNLGKELIKYMRHRVEQYLNFLIYLKIVTV